MGRTENLDERVFCCLWTPRLHTMPHWEGDILANPISSLLIVQRLLGYQWNSGLLHSVAVALVLLQSKGGCWYPRTSPGLEPSWPATYVAQCSEGSVRGLTQKRRKHEWCHVHAPQNIPPNECCRCEQPVGKQEHFFIAIWLDAQNDNIHSVGYSVCYGHVRVDSEPNPRHLWQTAYVSVPFS